MAHRKKNLCKIILLGDIATGKTSLMNQYVNHRFSGQYKCTIGADFLVKELDIDGQLCMLQIWDTAGMERAASLGSAFYRGSDAVVFVYDVTRPETLDHVATWKANFLDQISAEDTSSFPFVVFGNKVDLPNRLVSQKKAQEFCAKANMPHYEVSAREGTNVDEGFKLVVRAALENQGKNNGLPPCPPGPVVRIEPSRQECRGGICMGEGSC